jgi:pimeloyl-ACP methyl ester carboxylesterase
MKVASPLEKPAAIGQQAITVTGYPKPLQIAYAEWQPEDAYRGTILAVHGYSRQKRDFDFLAGTLAKNGYQVLAVDVPGRGGSSWLADPNLYNLDFYADVFVAFLKHMSLSKAHWIGTSMGGLIALRMAEKGRANLFRSLTLVDITHKPARAGLDRISNYITEDLPTFTNPDQYLEILKKTLPLGAMTPDYVWKHYALHQLKKNGDTLVFHFDPKIARRALVDFKSNVDLTDGMTKIACPLALVAGGVSDLCTSEEIKSVQALQPEVAVHICPSAGHVPALADAPTQTFVYKTIQSS